jgi:hypothetical protein
MKLLAIWNNHFIRLADVCYILMHFYKFLVIWKDVNDFVTAARKETFTFDD